LGGLGRFARINYSERVFMEDYGCGTNTNLALSRLSISKGVIHLIPNPIQASGILIFFFDAEAISLAYVKNVK